MAVRLRTAEGIIKEYQTARVLFVSYGDGFSIDKYVTKCGREWKPGAIKQACDHLECAIYLAEQHKDDFAESSKFLIVLAFVVFMVGIRWPQQFDFNFILSGFIILLGFYFLFLGLRSGKRFKELTEYRDKGTINGIKARQIFECLYTR